MKGLRHLNVPTCHEILLGVLFILFFVDQTKTQLIGSIRRCEKEGEEIFIPNISDNPCIYCFCKNKEVTCRRTQCPSLDGCHMILYENIQDNRKCCEMCKGCTYQNKEYASGDQWSSPDDPCVQLSCRAGVITKAKTKCYSNCKNPIQVPGKCCPICQGCENSGRTYQNGEEFTLSTDACTKCTCQNGNVSCAKEVCPVLNCPESTIIHKENECCPSCEGQRKIFNLPNGFCFFQKKIYKTNDIFRPEDCTECKCLSGTIVCDRETCPPITCSYNMTVKSEDSCCRVCPQRDVCIYEGTTYQDSEVWQPNLCTRCSCDDGTTRCRVQQCKVSSWCPAGYVLKYIDGECCPRCVEASGICTVFGDPHYRTFDGRIYNFQGACKYLLAEDEVSKKFSVTVRNDARSSPWFTWTRMLTIFIGKTKIGLHQKLTVKVNRKRIKLPYKNKNPTFSVHRDGNSVIFKAEFGLQVVWDGDSYVELTVSSQYKRRMAGLCGNYNGFGSDDLQGRDHKLYTDSEEFGNTWRVGSKAACVLSHNESEHSSLCDGDKRRRKRAIAACSFLLGSVFSKCRRRVDVRTYYSSCISDMCDCPRNKMCACESFKAYAQSCSRENVSIRWEKHILCPSQCPRGAIYRRCTRRCSKTCDEPKKTGYCRDKCQPACICPGKRVLHNGKCIAPHTCPGAPSPSL